MSRFGVLVLCSLLFAVASGSSLSYTVYSDAYCGTAVTSGTQSTTFRSAEGASGYVTGCFSLGLTSVGSYAQAGCVTSASGSGYDGVITTFLLSNCAATSVVGAYVDVPTGSCGQSTADSGTSGSVVIKCNWAYHAANVSLPLLALLAIGVSLTV